MTAGVHLRTEYGVLLLRAVLKIWCYYIMTLRDLVRGGWEIGGVGEEGSSGHGGRFKLVEVGKSSNIRLHLGGSPLLIQSQACVITACDPALLVEQRPTLCLTVAKSSVSLPQSMRRCRTKGLRGSLIKLSLVPDGLAAMVFT
jgi:hypothetical protein